MQALFLTVYLPLLTQLEHLYANAERVIIACELTATGFPSLVFIARCSYVFIAHVSCEIANLYANYIDKTEIQTRRRVTSLVLGAYIRLLSYL